MESPDISRAGSMQPTAQRQQRHEGPPGPADPPLVLLASELERLCRHCDELAENLTRIGMAQAGAAARDRDLARHGRTGR